MSKKRLVVIDGKSVFYRGYYAMPNLATKEGRPTGGVYGFALMALEVLKKYNPDFVCVAWDKPKTNIHRRTKIYPDYKANRKPAPPDFYEQVPILHELLEVLGWPLYEIDDHEADDIMGTFAAQADKKGYETILISSDKDLLQLVSENTSVATLKKGLTNVEVFDPKHFRDVYNMTTDQFIDYKSLRGDPSDNLPGVRGVGEKTALLLINEYGTLDNVYKNIDKIKPTTAKKLETDKELAYITKELVKLDLKVPLKMDWKQAAIANLNPKKLQEKLLELEFRTLLKQLPEEFQYVAKKKNRKTNGISGGEEVIDVTKKSDLPKLKNGVALYVHSYCKKTHSRGLHTLLASDGNNNWLIDVKELGDDFTKWLKSQKMLKVVGHDSKQTIKAFMWLGVDGIEVEHDTKVAAFLINSLLREQTLTALARDELGFDEVELDDVHPDDIASRAPAIIQTIKALHKVQLKQLDKLKKVEKLALEIEWPAIPVLAKMEFDGIELDTKYLKKMSAKLEDRISDETQQIYGFADQEFNISSPVQLSEILYNKLGLPTHGVKKGKTGFSTAARELEKLQPLHPIVDHLFAYREMTKLKSTYVDALPKLVDKDGRLRTTFALTVTQTGRLSSHDPNLQNIPVRTELGKEIRYAFVAKKGHAFISADYSQFELRLAAELAGDDELIEAFNDGLDIHTRTAAQVFGTALEDVTKDQRASAKTINFGVLYGMSPHGLSRATSMNPKEAKDFIDRYFALRKPILDYIDKTKEKAKNEGYVETMFGRRRPTPDVNSSNFVVREAALRAAVNMPIQGTEADIMKMAMVEIEKHLDEDSKQLLQIHDSILFEVPEEKADKVSKLVKGIMEGVYDMKVNLDVDVSIGSNWGEL